MVRQQRNQKNSSRVFVAKSTVNPSEKGQTKKLFLLVLFALTLIQCSTPKNGQNANIPDRPQIIKGEDVPLYQLTFKGTSTEVSYSGVFNKLLYSKRLADSTSQIFELDLSNNQEKRITYNLGDNQHPSFHPFKSWITYSSSRDETIEKVPVDKLMKEYGLKDSPLMENEMGHEVYISTIDGSDIERITKHRGFDGHPVFSADGLKLLHLRHFQNQYQILETDTRNANSKILISQKAPIVDFHTNAEHLAWISIQNDKEFEIKIVNTKKATVFELKTQSEIKSIFLNKTGTKLLVSATFDDENNLDIYEIDWSLKCRTRLTQDKNQDTGPVYGPESKSIFFSSDRSGSYQIYARNLNPNSACVPLQKES